PAVLLLLVNDASAVEQSALSYTTLFRSDVKPMQQELMKEVAERMRANVKALDPETMLKTWLPAGLQGFEQLQEMFLNQMAGRPGDRKSTRLNSSHEWISYAVFCLQQKNH